MADEMEVMRKQMAEMMAMMTKLTKEKEAPPNVWRRSDTYKYDPDLLVCNIFSGKIYPQVTNNIMVLDLLRHLYKQDPSIFKTYGGIHTDTDGVRLYQGLKINITPTFCYTAHLYGSYRFEKFTLKSMEIYYKSFVYIFDFEKPE